MLVALIFLTLLVSGVDAAVSVSIYVVPIITDNKILTDSSISSAYLSDDVSISAAKGEYEPASFVVRSGTAIPSLKVEATDLTGSAGTIPAANVDIRTVKVWWQAGYEISDLSHKHLTPELLLKDDSLVTVSGSDNYIKLSDGRQLKISDPAGVPGVSDTPYNDEFPVKDSKTLLPVNLPKNYNKQFWITVKVPDNTAAGNYSGKVYLKDGTQTLGEIDLNVTVLPLKLSDSRLEYSIYYGSVLRQKGCISSYDRNEVQYRAEQEDLYAHGVIAPIIREQWVYDGNLKIRKEAGTSNKNIYHWGLSIDYYGNDADRLKEAIQLYKDNTKPFGTENYYIYGVDEKDLNNPTNRAQIKAAHEAGAKVFCAEFEKKSESDIADVLDLLIVGGTPDPSLAALYHGYGHRIFSYGNPQGGEEKPGTYRRNYGLLLWQKDYDGAMDFAYQWSYSNIWNDFDDINCAAKPWCYRDHNFVYPTVDGVIDTIQWEGFREGVDDIRYLSTLLDRVEYAKKKGRDVSSTEKWISDLKKSDLSKKNLDDVRKEMTKLILSLPGPVCLPGETNGCKVCNEEGTAWADDNSKCPTGQACQSGACIITCAPTTCSTLGYNCGAANDGCGGTLNCGTCPTGQTCSNGICVIGCTPKNCTQLGYTCGTASNGCGGTLSCGTCGANQICQSGQCVANQTEPSNVTNLKTCKINQTCSFTVNGCSNGLAFVRNLVGKPIDLRQMIISGDFPITFFYSSPYTRLFVPSNNGTAGVLMICFSGIVRVERSEISILTS